MQRKHPFNMKLPLSLLIIVLLSCNSETGTGISEKDAKALRQLHEDYIKFWLQNDSAKVVDLFLENGAIVPPNNKGDIVKGRKSIGAWWFTANGDTTYPITSFVYKNDSLTAAGNLATWEGVSEVGWETRVKDSVVSAHSSVTNFITVCKKENGEWKIYRQIWNQKPSK
jgi:ketosteroid isomerase-like protein